VLLLSFTDLILLSTVLLSAVFLALRLLTSRMENLMNLDNDVSYLRLNSNALQLLHLVCLFTTLTLLVISFFPRGTVWFILRLISLALLSVYALTNPKSATIPFYLLITVAASSIAPIVSLGFGAGEVDQLAHVLAVNYILSNGHIYLAQEALFGSDPYYHIFPVIDFLVSDVAKLTGLNAFFSIVFLEVLVPIVVCLALCNISYQLSRNYLPAILSVMILLASARLAVWLLIPQNLSLFYSLIALISLIGFVFHSSRISAGLTILFVFFANIAHASFGGIFLALTSIVALIFSIRKMSYKSKMSILAVTILVETVSYWVVWNLSSSFNSNFESILQEILTAFSSRSTTASVARISLLNLASPYSFLGFAVPCALSFSYAGYYFLERSTKAYRKIEVLLICATIIAFVVLGIAFYSSTSFGTQAIERYSDVPTYTIFMIVGSLGGFSIIAGKRNFATIIVFGILIVSLGLSSYQLNWAPDQFASNYSYAGERELIFTHIISYMLPSDIIIYNSQVLIYLDYWNQTKSNTFVPPPDLATKISINRSITSDFLVSYVENGKVQTSMYLVFGVSLISDPSDIANSSHFDLISSDGQYVVIKTSR
jgi:hypothetical protein